MRKVFILALLLMALVPGCTRSGPGELGEFVEMGPTCESDPDPVFTADITDLDKVSMIVPPGTLEGTMLKTHSYVQVKEKAPVYAPHDAYLYEGAFYTEEGMTQYLLFFQATCEVLFIFDHIQEPVVRIREAFPDAPADDTGTVRLEAPLFFEEGELVGHSTGTRLARHFDFGVYNRARPNHLAQQEGYGLSERDLIANCPYDYFPEEKRDLYYSLFGSFIDDKAPRSFCKG